MKRNIHMFCLCFLVCVTAGRNAAAEAVHYVNDDAVGANNGTTWVDAYTDLQSALASAKSGDEIWVAEGTYTPAPPGDAVTSFELREGVTLYGGFAGNEFSPTQRDWNAHPTILSGDVGRDDVYGSPTWYIGWNITTPNSGHVVVGSGVGPSAILDGFTIAAGHTGPAGTPAGDPLMYGSGLYIVAGSPSVRNCTFLRNVAAFAAGGAIYSQDASPSITNCRFVQNWVHLGNGAGIAIVGSDAPSVISDCVFIENRAIADSGNTGQGSGLSINFITAPLAVAVERCTFAYNVAQTFYPAGGIEIARGGGISNFGATLTVRDCVFHHNSANAGAGIQTWDPATIINCLFHDNTVYSHDFGAGSDGGYGAAICIYSFQPDTATVLNCTIAKNTGGEGVGMQSLANADFVVRNTIIWGNTATGQDVAPLDAQIKGNYSAEYSCIQDLLTPIPGEDPPDPKNFPGCIVVDPQFVNIATRDLHLSGASPCIDAGRNSDVLSGVVADLEGWARFFDEPGIVDTGVGTPPLVDMGASEFVPLVVGDVDCDGDLDLDDLAALADVLLGQDVNSCHLRAADMNADDAADSLDIQLLVLTILGA